MNKISIILPTFNRANLVVNAIESVINQLYTNWELLIIDDGSTDNTPDVVSKYLQDSRIKYYKKNNTGGANSRNIGVEKAKSKWITFLDSDDVAYENWLSRYEKVVNNPNVDFVCSGHDFYEDDQFLYTKLPLPMGPAFINIVGRFLAGSFIIRKSLYEEIGGIDEDLPSGHWTDFSLKLSSVIRMRKLTFDHIDVSLVRVNIHNGDRIRNNNESKRVGTMMLLNKHRETLLLDTRMFRNFLRISIALSYKAKKYGAVLKLLWIYSPFIFKYGLRK